MPKYKIINKPMLVRNYPGPDAAVVNVLNPGKEIEVVTLENGWFKLINGYYLFKNDNVKLITETEEFPDPENNPSKVFSLYGVQRFDQSSSGSSGQTLNDQTTPSGNVGNSRSATNALGTNAAVGSTDTSSGDRVSIEELNRRFTGPNTQWSANSGPYAFQVDNDGKLITNSDGSPKSMQIPITLLGKNNGSTVLSIDDRGYVKVRDINGSIYIVDGRQGQVSVDPTTDDYYSIPVTDVMIAKRESDSVISSVQRILEGDTESILPKIINVNEIDIHNIQGIFGYPYQFLPIADPRLISSESYGKSAPFGFDDLVNHITIETNENKKKAKIRTTEPMITNYVKELVGPNSLGKIGRQFSRKIAARAPIMTIQAGIPVFLKGYSEEAKRTIIDELTGAIDGLSGISLDEILSSNGQYYSFQEAHDQYFKAVNDVCRSMSIFLGINQLPAKLVVPHNSEILDFSLDLLDWQTCVQHSYFGYFKGAVCFYINAEPQVHEQFTNATRQSQLASSVNQISDQAMEIQFILGGLGAAGAGTYDWPKDGITGVGEGLSNAEHFRNGTGLMQSMLKNIRTFLSGGKMIFPEIWADSSFGRTYNVTIKLTSPDCDKLSIYLNILVPLAHILGFVLPRSVGDNSYISPFLVRCWFQSQFNIELGIISSCEVIKGDAGSWTQDGLPTQLTVQLSIKDLYSVMAHSLSTPASSVLNNPMQMNYIANLCGINMGPTDIRRTIALWKMIAFSKGKDSIFRKIPNMIASALDGPVTAINTLANAALTWFAS